MEYCQRTGYPSARCTEYFAPLAEATRKLDPTRPITCVNVMFCDAHTDTISDLLMCCA
ncbi:glycoside hydrolase family 2 TIM barrel-domain containing protein [Escherichia coli]|uniref:glycoside hydrolase family 2 TIM barrel-domain containing protein n=1 Tax=Escherichia coli TaxID=562 RepID=UPI00388E1D7B